MLGLLFAGVLMATDAHAVDVVAYASVDLGSTRLLAAKSADSRLRPASLTKLMTAHLILQDVRAGRLKLKQRYPVSQRAATQAPVRVGLRAGRRYVLEELLKAAVVRSGNDAASALAEISAGTEAAFVQRMNEQAKQLGMRNTRFANAHGLPAEAAYSSARDMARLVLAISKRHPRHQRLFALRAFKLEKRAISGHNQWLEAYIGADGMKTGFTCRAGHNLAATATRYGRRIVVVVLGAKSNGARLAATKTLMDAAFARPATAGVAVNYAVPSSAARAVPAANIADSCKKARYANVKGFGPSRWSVTLDVNATKAGALKYARRFIEHFATGAKPYLTPRVLRGVAYRYGATGLSQQQAIRACLRARKLGLHCVVQPPVVAHLQWTRAVNMARRAPKDTAKRTAKAKRKR